MSVRRCLVNFLPRVQHGSVLVTTRDRGCALSLGGSRTTPIEVLQMSLNESVKLLRIWLPEADQQEASELIHELENMPLAISQAGAYIKEMIRVPIPKYLSIFRRSNEDQVALLNKNKRDLWRDPGVPNAVITSWELSFQHIRERYPDSADLMSLMSCFNRQAIPAILIKEGIDDITLEENINVLLSFSLIRAETEKDSFEMHRLVQAAMRHWLRSEGCDQLWKECAIQRVAEQFPEAEHQMKEWPLCEYLMSHADEVIQYTAGSSESELHRASVLANTAWYLYVRKGYNVLGEVRLADALRVQRQYLDDNSNTTLGTLEMLALIQSANLKYEEARGLQEFILERRLKISGHEHSATIRTLHNLALTHYQCGQLEKAKDLLERAMEVGQNLSDSQLPILLNPKGLLGTVFLALGKFEEAEKLSKKVLETRTRLGLEDLDTLTTMLDLSAALSYQTKYEEAQNLNIQAVTLSTSLFGPKYWRTIQAKRYLCETLHHQGRLDEAQKIGLSCLGMAKEVHGPRLETTVWDIQNVLSCIYRAQGKFADASNLSKVVLESSTKTLGVDHPVTILYMQNLALLHYDVGDKKSAIRLMTKVLEKRRRILPAEHPDTIDSAACLADWKGETEGSEEEKMMERTERKGISIQGR